MTEGEMHTKYNKLIEEVKEFVLKIENKNSSEKILKKYYRGVQVLYGPLINRPRVLFIGINPGAGYFNYNKKNVRRYNPLEHFEYIHMNYLLAKQTRSLLKKAGIENLENCVKTNCFFFSTKNKRDLDIFLGHFKNEDIYKLSAIWRHKLIEIMQPKIIVCEGKSAFDWVTKKYSNIKIRDDGKVFQTEFNNIKVVGYRRRMSYILNKDEVSKVLTKVLNE